MTGKGWRGPGTCEDDMTLGCCSRLPSAPSWLLPSGFHLTWAAGQVVFICRWNTSSFTATNLLTLESMYGWQAQSALVSLSRTERPHFPKPEPGVKEESGVLMLEKLMTAKKKKCTGLTRCESNPGTGAEETGRGFLHVLQSVSHWRRQYTGPYLQVTC